MRLCADKLNVKGGLKGVKSAICGHQFGIYTGTPALLKKARAYYVLASKTKLKMQIDPDICRNQRHFYYILAARLNTAVRGRKSVDTVTMAHTVCGASARKEP